MNAKRAAAGSAATKSNRLSSLFDQLERLWPIAKSGQPEEREVEHVRYVTNKLQQLLSSQEKCRKELMHKSNSGIFRLLTVLEITSKWDLQATVNTVSCFNELLTSGKRIGALTDFELPEVLFQTLTTVFARDTSKESAITEELIVLLHVVFSKMGTKDKRFPVQARITGALQISLNVAKQNPQNFKVLHPVLQVLKIYAGSPVNCNIMVKGGAIETFIKILPFCGQKRVLSAKVILEILTQLVKSKIGARRAVLQGAVPLILNMFVEWHRTDHRHRQVTLRKAILTVLKNIVMINSGRKALGHLDGMKVLYNIGLEGLECKELDGIIKLIILILRRCFARPTLPVRTASSIFSHGVLSPAETESSTDNSEDDMIDTESSESDRTTITEAVYKLVSADDNDDMVDDEERETMDFECERSNSAMDADIRNKQDLEMYQEFLTEQLEYRADQCRYCNLEDNKVDISPIRIPTAAMYYPDSACSSDELPSFEEDRTGLPFIKKSRSFDNTTSLLQNCNATTNIFFTSNSDNDPDIMTETMILDLGNFTTLTSPPRTKMPIMSSIPILRTHNFNELDSIDFMVKGIRLQNSRNSSPSLGRCAGGKYPTKTTQNRDSSLSDRCITPIIEKVRSNMDVIPSSNLERQPTPNDSSENIRHMLPFVKQASPIIHGHYPVVEPEPLIEKRAGLHRVMIFQDFLRFISPDQVINRVVYDLDNLVSQLSNISSGESITSNYMPSPKKSGFVNNKSSNSLSGVCDEIWKDPTLQFESRFESGNLRKAIQIRQYEYDLLLNPDINSDHHCQWFYFEVSNMEADVPYRFNIINCEKFNSQFNFGMQPVLFSSKHAEDGQPGWERTGCNICYYKNFYQRKGYGHCANKYFYTTTFSIKFPYANDSCYLAYHYPFPYSMMKAHIKKIEAKLTPNIYYKNQKLCSTSSGNDCDILTITEKPTVDDLQSAIAFRKRPYIVLTSRVHPGESCSSWVTKGLLDYLMSDDEAAVRLRKTYIFKIIPLLNPDGVINGNHRCSISGDDLNRQWVSPSPINHPTIYHAKGFIQYLNTINKTPLVYCDFHGHSRRKNIFMYGCSVAATVAARQHGNADTVTFVGIEGEFKSDGNVPDETDINEDTGYKTLPRILNSVAPAFSINSCSYVMEKSKESTARIVVFKELGVVRSYTVESTYCGADQGPYKGNQFGTRELEEMGKNFCIGLWKLSQSYSVKLKPDLFKEPCFCDRRNNPVNKIDPSVENGSLLDAMNDNEDCATRTDNGENAAGN